MRSLKVKDYLAKKLVIFTPEMNVVEAMTQILANSISAAPVVDANGQPVGILSEVDLMAVVIQDSYCNEPLGHRRRLHAGAGRYGGIEPRYLYVG